MPTLTGKRHMCECVCLCVGGAGNRAYKPGEEEAIKKD